MNVAVFPLSELKRCLLVLEANAGAHNIVVGADQESELVQGAGAVNG